MKKLSKREKVLLGVSIVGAGVAGFGIYYINKKFGIEIHKLVDENVFLIEENKSLKNRVKILEEVISEDVLEEAIATTTRKLNYRVDKIEAYKLRTDNASVAKLKEHMYFKNVFETRLKDFNELKRLRYIEK